MVFEEADEMAAVESGSTYRQRRYVIFRTHPSCASGNSAGGNRGRPSVGLEGTLLLEPDDARRTAPPGVVFDDGLNV